MLDERLVIDSNIASAYFIENFPSLLFECTWQDRKSA